jgi:predicted dehydrogenase
MPDTVRFGIIGCGGISNSHLRSIAGIAGAEAVALADVNETALNERAEQYGVARRYREWNDLLRDEAVQAVSVCLPHSLHERAVLDAARHGKHVLCEKPFCLSLAECDRMIAAAVENGVLLMSAQVLRRYPANKLAKQWIQEGRIGRVASVQRRRMGNSIRNLEGYAWANKPEIAGGWLLYGYGAHEYDTILWLLDTTVNTVAAVGAHNKAIWNDYDEITAVMQLHNGAVATMIQSLNSAVSAWDCVVIGDEGTIEIRSGEIALNREKTEVPLDGPAAFREQVQEFVDCIRAGREPGPSGQNVRATMQALEGVKIALAEHRVVNAGAL